ncbi:unnamed protein product [Ambrosiozyma monospora]|uniref:Unnamed protein product n=1 Tax=Ambrosiozyma monospora TaxID=43982 RepID=A0ACB5TDI3_AMBMO|nr:unnamed protein product [Ambrosiozyma monospora]
MISSVRASILGNDKEKQRVVSQLDLFKSILLHESDPSLLKNTAIIIQSFSFAKESATYLIENGMIDALITCIVKRPGLAELNLKTLFNLLSTTSMSGIDLNDYSDGRNLILALCRILNRDSSSSSLLVNVYLLIPFFKQGSGESGDYVVSRLLFEFTYDSSTRT